MTDTITTPDAVLWATSAFKSRGEAYTRYRHYINGDQPLEFATEKFKSAFGRQFRTFAYNRCAMVVDAHADRLQVLGFGSDAKQTVIDPETGEETEVDHLAQEAQVIWDQNQMDVREGQVEAEAFGMGDGYVIVEVEPTTGDILIWPQYAANVRVKYNDGMPGQRDQAARRWVADDKYLRLNLYFPDRIEKYRSVQKATGSDSLNWNTATWQPYQPDGDTAWPVMLAVTDTVPVFHFGNNARVNDYGQSELRDVLPLQDAINKTVMDMLVAMEFAAFPQRVALNVDDDDPATQDSIKRFQVGLDRLMVLRGSGELPPAIAEFSAANMTQYLDVAEKFDQFIARVTRVPSRYLTQEAVQVSGTSKRMDEAPWVSKIEDRQRAFGAVWADVMSYALRLKGFDVAPGAIRVNWQAAAPLSAEEQLNLNLAKSSLGYPLQTILREAGYEPAQIATIMEEKQQQADEARRMFDRGDVVPEGNESEAA